MSRMTEYSRNGLTFDVADGGPEDGAPIVLLHGFPQRASSWSLVAADLNERGLRTYSPDQRGYSPRARPSGRFAYRASELAGDIEALIDTIGQPVHLVGHDWGASVAWTVALRSPQRLRSLTAVCVGHPSAFFAAPDQLLRSWYFWLFQLPFIPAFVVRAILHTWNMSPAQLEEFDRDIVAAGALSGGLKFYRALPFASPRLIRTRCAVPTAVVWGNRDWTLGRRQAEKSARWVDADYRFHALDSNHWIPQNSPAELSAAIADRAESI